LLLAPLSPNMRAVFQTKLAVLDETPLRFGWETRTTFMIWTTPLF
jgi:hypothetical protein